jgi:hypothetical protein
MRGENLPTSKWPRLQERVVGGDRERRRSACTKGVGLYNSVRAGVLTYLTIAGSLVLSY